MRAREKATPVVDEDHITIVQIAAAIGRSTHAARRLAEHNVEAGLWERGLARDPATHRLVRVYQKRVEKRT